MFYKLSGKGAAVVFIHGFCETNSIWDSMVNKLNDRYHCIQVDLPGFGNSLTEESSIEAWAIQLHHILMKEKIQKLHLCGHSMGGYVCLAYAGLFNESVLSLTLINSHCFADSEAKKKMREKTIQHLQQYGSHQFVHELFPQLFYDTEKHKYAIQQRITEALKLPTETLINSYRAMIERPSTEAILRRAAFPVLFLNGQEDKTIDREPLLQQSALPQLCSVKFFEESAHMSFVEYESDCLRLMEEIWTLDFT